jgi:transposase
MRAYSQDLRDRVLNALGRSESPTAIAKRFEVSRIWVYQVKQRWEEEGKRSSLPMGGYRKSCLAPLESTIRSWIKDTSDITLKEMCERLEELGVSIKAPALWHQLNNWSLSYKKNAAPQRTRTRGHPSTEERMATEPDLS